MKNNQNKLPPSPIRSARFFAIILVFLLIFLPKCPGDEKAIHTEFKICGMFKDRAVLQRDRKIPVWGWAEPGEKITVQLNGEAASATAAADGKWQAVLSPLSAGGPYDLTVSGPKTITVRDILIGEVWLCAGQSNMALPVNKTESAEAEISTADFPEIRYFRTDGPSFTPRKDMRGAWVKAVPGSVAKWSAVGYYFGRELHRHYNVPVGIINSSLGSTRIESWTSEEAILQHYGAEGRKEIDEREYFRAHRQEIEATKKVFPPNFASALYNGKVNSLIPYAVRGIIWYQGESNTGRNPYAYRDRFRIMINDWRKRWGQELPFIWVSLANYRKCSSVPGDPASTWALLRESQSATLSLPNTGQAVAIDIGDADNIHPKNKQEVARRLFLAARHLAYGEDLVYSGPQYKHMRVEGRSILLTFSHTGSGLVARGGPLRHFAVAGINRRFFAAQARIEGDMILVSSPEVTAPVAVRYAWADNPAGCNLYNSEGLPAVPFRTDTWPVVAALISK